MAEAPPPTLPFRITLLQAWACRVPIAIPVATSFGIMRNRPAVFLRIEDTDGAFGFGEVFANWPAAGAEHRANLLIDDLADLVLGRDWSDPAAMTDALNRQSRIRALQCGEPGPFRQVIAGLDTAAWDLASRRAGLPLAQLLSGGAPPPLPAPPAYASGIHIDAAPAEIARARAAGFRAFKVKIGFDAPAEPAKLAALAEGLQPGERLFCDANQAWDAATAARFIDASAGLPLGWLEEPIPADAAEAEWRLLAARGLPLAGGENIAGRGDFDAAIAAGALAFLQPDLAKWGGVSGCLGVARAALAAGRTYCPHFLGGGIGLAASAHVLAAAGGDGLLEVDVNPNPLRDAFLPDGMALTAGCWPGATAPGLGIEALPEAVTAAVTLHREATG